MSWLHPIAGFFFDNVWGRFAALGILVSGLIVGFAYDQRTIGARNATNEINQATGELVSKGRVAADAVPDDGGNWRRLRKKYCGDC